VRGKKTGADRMNKRKEAGFRQSVAEIFFFCLKTQA